MTDRQWLEANLWNDDLPPGAWDGVYLRCECGHTCISCAERAPEYDTPDGPFCAQCIGNGQYSMDTEVVERDVREHTHERSAR